MDALNSLISKSYASLREANEFVNAIKQRDSTVKNFEQNHLKRLQTAVLTGKVKEMQNCIKKSIPAEALFLIDGLEIPGMTLNPFPTQTDDIVIDTTKMTIFELVCGLKHHKLLDFMIKELIVRNNRDFTKSRLQKSIHE